MQPDREAQKKQLQDLSRVNVRKFMSEFRDSLAKAGVDVGFVNPEFSRLQVIINAVVDAQAEVMVDTWRDMLAKFPPGTTKEPEK